MPASSPIRETISPPTRDLALLPAQVAAIREKILAACDKGELEALRIPIDWNETRPMFQRGGKKRPAGSDPIETLRSLSFDRKGFEILNLARAALNAPYAKIQRGPVTLYEWPAFPAAQLSAEDARAQWRCVRFYDFPRPLPDGRPRVTRLGFGADGVWHYFWSEA
jgi:hypothetical protein